MPVVESKKKKSMSAGGIRRFSCKPNEFWQTAFMQFKNCNKDAENLKHYHSYWESLFSKDTCYCGILKSTVTPTLNNFCVDRLIWHYQKVEGQ